MTDPEKARELVRAYKRKGADFMKPYNLLRRDVYLALVDEAGKQRIPVAGHVPFSMTAKEVSDLGQRTIEHNFDVLISTSRDEDSLRAKLRARNHSFGQRSRQKRLRPTTSGRQRHFSRVLPPRRHLVVPDGCVL